MMTGMTTNWLWDTMNICLRFHWSFAKCCSDGFWTFWVETYFLKMKEALCVPGNSCWPVQKPQACRGSPNRECDIVDGFPYCYCECHTYHTPYVTCKSGLSPSTHVSTTSRYFGTRIVNPSTCCCQQISWTFALLHPFLSVWRQTWRTSIPRRSQSKRLCSLRIWVWVSSLLSPRRQEVPLMRGSCFPAAVRSWAKPSKSYKRRRKNCRQPSKSIDKVVPQVHRERC